MQSTYNADEFLRAVAYCESFTVNAQLSSKERKKKIKKKHVIRDTHLRYVA